MFQDSRERPEAPRMGEDRPRRVRPCAGCTRPDPWRAPPVRVRSVAPRTALLTIAIGLVALVLAGCGTPAGATDKGKTSGTITLKVDGRERSYLLEPATGDKSSKGSALVA